METTTAAGKATWVDRARLFAFLYLSAMLMVVASERIYWYWSGVTVDSILGLTLVYSLPAAAGLWALAINGARRLSDVVLAGAVFAFVVEGVVTPVIYFDGFLPIFAAMFVGWHGIVGFLGAWYLVRKLLLAGRDRLLALVSVVAGLGWGAWARAAATGETLDVDEVAALAAEGIDTSILSPSEFAVYASLVGVIFMAGHWLVGYVWPQRWVPGKRSTRAVVFLALGYMSLAVLPAVIWAPLKLAVLIGGTLLLMRRGSQTAGPNIVEQLHGRIPLRRTLALAPLPIAAALAYWIVATSGMSDDGLLAIYWSAVAAQVIGGGGAYVWAARRAMQAPSLPAQETELPVVTDPLPDSRT